MKPFKKRKRLWLLAFIPAGGLLIGAAALFPAFAEWYSAYIYPPISGFFAWITGFATFSVAEVALWILLAAVVCYPVWVAYKLIRIKTQRKQRALLYVINPVIFAGIIFFAYSTNIGVNYYREPFAVSAGLEVKASSVEELVTLCTALAEEMNTLREEVSESADGIAVLNGDFVATAKEAKSAFDKIEEDYPVLKSGYNHPKPVVLSKVMSYMNITGIFSPFTFEGNINIDAPGFNQPATMTHELSHLRGFMREDEANFIAVLVCKKSDDPIFRYSGAVLSYIHSINALYTSDTKAASEISAALSEGVRRDFNFNNSYWKQFETPVGEVSSAINDSYLKANGQTDGVKSYGRMVDLLLALQREEAEKQSQPQAQE